MEWVRVNDVTGGPGWIISGRTLLPCIVDRELFRQTISADYFAEAIELLWTGEAALALKRLEGMKVSSRQQALTADCLRDLGRFSEAENIYRSLLDSAPTPSSKATYHQHLGKILLYAGQYLSAQEQFETALTMRKASASKADLLASSRQACDFMRILLTEKELA